MPVEDLSPPPNTTESLAVKNNNPGNIRNYKTGEFAIYNTPEEGTNALLNQIDLYKSGKSMHTDGSENLSELIHIYAPSSDNNDPIAYTKDLANILGVTTTTPIKDIPTGKLALGIAKIEDTSMYEILINDPASAEAIKKASVKPTPEPTLQWGTETEPVINSELTAPVNVTKSKVETSIKKKGTPKEAGLIEQATNTLIDEGVGALLSQVGNKISNVYYEKTGGKEDIVIEDKQIMTQDEWLNAVKMKVPPFVNNINTDQEWLKPSMPEVTLLSSATKNTDYKDIIYQPLSVNTTKAKFGYRNRGNNKDIKSSGALFSTYNPFRSTSKYLGWHTEEGKANFKGANASSNSVIALNTKTGEVMGGTFKDFANNPDIVVSRTLPAKKVVSIGVSKDNKYFDGISQRGTKLTLANGTQQDIPIGIGSDNSGNRLTGWSGGKMFITKPDGSEGHFVYGTVKQLSSQLNKYKKTHQIDHVLWYDMDHKAFSQAYQTNTGTLYGNYNIERDNTNSTGGHFLYLK